MVQWVKNPPVRGRCRGLGSVLGWKGMPGASGNQTVTRYLRDPMDKELAGYSLGSQNQACLEELGTPPLIVITAVILKL